MSSYFNETHLALRDTVRRFAQSDLAPQAAHLDEAQGFNEAALRKMGSLGILGITADEAYGGSQMDVLAATLVMEEFGAVCASTTLSYLAHSILAVNNLNQNGNETQKKKYLPKLCSGEWIGSMAMSEAGAGSDALGMQLQARKEGKNFVLNGTKMWITNAPYSHFFWVYAKTGPTKKDISTFIVEKTFPGFSIGKKLDKLGMRASPTAELIFNNCVVPEENLVGKGNDSVEHMMKNLLIERITISGISLGLARSAIEYCSRYAMDRKQFEKPLLDFQMIQQILADATADYLAARSLVYEAATAADRHDSKALQLGTSAKLFAAKMATKVCLDAVQVLGGYGYTKEYPVERYLRDAKLMEIGAGTNEVMRIILAKELQKGNYPGL